MLLSLPVVCLLLVTGLALEPLCPSLVPSGEGPSEELDLSAFNVDTDANYFLQGSCAAYREVGCCTVGECAGDPPSIGCYCDRQCHNLEDCCRDIGNTCLRITEDDVNPLKFVELNRTSGVEQVFLNRTGDNLSQAIHIPGGFPFGDTNQTVVYVSAHGYFSFGDDVNDFSPVPLLESGYTYFVSPFWAGVTLEGDVAGQVSYEVHSTRDAGGSPSRLARVSEYLREKVNESFEGDWMLIGEWRDVPPMNNPGSSTETNTFQGILITDGSQSYTIFLHECGELQWSGGATIGFIADQHFYYNHRLSGTKNTKSIACRDVSVTPWTTLVYKIAPPPIEDVDNTVVLYPLIDGGNVTYFVAAPNNIETVFFNLLESVTNLPVFLEWTESGNHTLYFIASSWSLDYTIAPPACIEPNSGKLEPGQSQVLDVEVGCNGAGQVYMQACFTVGTQPFDLLNGTYHTYTFFYPRQCTGSRDQSCTPPLVGVVPGELCLTSEQFMSLVAYPDSSWSLLGPEFGGNSEFCIVSSEETHDQAITANPGGASSLLLLPIPEAFNNLSLFIGQPPYVTTPVTYSFSFEVEKSTILDPPYIDSGNRGIVYTNRTDIQLQIPCRQLGRSQVFATFSVSSIVEGTLYQDEYHFNFQKRCASNTSAIMDESASNTDDSISVWLPIVIVAVVLLVMVPVATIVAMSAYIVKIRRSRKHVVVWHGHEQSGSYRYHNTSTVPSTFEALQKYGIEYDYSKLELLEELGQGHFGVVYKGKAPDIHRDGYIPGEFVAIKTLKSESFHSDVLEEFLKEVCASVEFHHVNVIRLLGVCTKLPQKCMIFEYMDLGALNELLRLSDPAIPSSPDAKHANAPITPDLLLDCVLQVARGLNYLASLNFVHRDVATRNCLVNQDLLIKIADFGMSRAVDASNYYQIGSGNSFLPVRWMPPEAILHGKFTAKSDVWSFGILMWEVYTFGHQPYAGISNYEVVDEIKNHHVLERPALCPLSVYAIMTSCWMHASSKRPTMGEILEHLKVAGGGGVNLEDDDEYVSMAPVVAMKYSELLALEGEDEQHRLEEELEPQ